MGIKVPERMSEDRLAEVLIAKGWKRGVFNGKEAFIKELESWLWVAYQNEEGLSFISFPKEEDSRLHSRGVSLLRREVEEIGRVLGFTLPVSLNEVV